MALWVLLGGCFLCFLFLSGSVCLLVSLFVLFLKRKGADLGGCGGGKDLGGAWGGQTIIRVYCMETKLGRERELS